MAEEFQESEVIFHENAGIEENAQYKSTGNKNAINSNKLKRKNKKKKNSAPVNIPEIASGNANSVFQYVDSDFFEDEYDDDDGEITPPHVILGRRIAGKMAFSVCTGNGRTLKGRDLSEVRNCVLRMTGFLEA